MDYSCEHGPELLLLIPSWIDDMFQSYQHYAHRNTPEQVENINPTSSTFKIYKEVPVSMKSSFYVKNILRFYDLMSTQKHLCCTFEKLNNI